MIFEETFFLKACNAAWGLWSVHCHTYRSIIRIRLDALHVARYQLELGVIESSAGLIDDCDPCTDVQLAGIACAAFLAVGEVIVGPPGDAACLISVARIMRAGLLGCDVPHQRG